MPPPSGFSRTYLAVSSLGTRRGHSLWTRLEQKLWWFQGTPCQGSGQGTRIPSAFLQGAEFDREPTVTPLTHQSPCGGQASLLTPLPGLLHLIKWFRQPPKPETDGSVCCALLPFPCLLLYPQIQSVAQLHVFLLRTTSATQ